jgi:hypothetical protein
VQWNENAVGNGAKAFGTTAWAGVVDNNVTLCNACLISKLVEQRANRLRRGIDIVVHVRVDGVGIVEIDFNGDGFARCPSSASAALGRAACCPNGLQ